MHENRARLLAAVLGPPPAGGDIASVFDRELTRLPARYRTALVLCYLQGMTTEEAARRLRRPRASMERRLARVRRLLRARLARRGVPTSAAALGAFLLSAQARAGTVPAPLVEATVRAGVGFAKPQAAEQSAAES
jgi:hypothetical protein